MKSKVISNKEAKEKLLIGVNVIADAVSSTLGPRGQNVAIAKGTPRGEIYDRTVLHDGVSVARAIDLSDEFENMGAQLLAEASKKQVDKVGDGTTVVMILAQAIINECMQMISTGINPMSLRKDLEQTTEVLIKKLNKLAIPLKTFDQMKQIATISAEDNDLGKLVAETLKKVGKDGVVTVEESKSAHTSVEYQEGMQLDQGYLHDLMITNPERMEAIFENPYILVTDKPITSLIPFTKFFEQYTSKGVVAPLVVISPDISGEALPLFIKNKLDGKLYTLCIKAPSMGKDQKGILQDIAVLTGAKFITEDAGHRFEDLTINDLGMTKSVVSTKKETIISGGYGKKDNITKRIASIKKEIEAEQSEFDKERLKARLGKLTNGVAVIRVGGLTEVEMKERRERVLDSVAALKAAMDKGIVPGGEIIYLQIREGINNKILYNALGKPFRKLITNADLLPENVALLLNGKDKHFGIDVTDGKVKDFIEVGIVDPVSVSIEAIKNAVSVAIQIITTGTIIVPDIKEDK